MVTGFVIEKKDSEEHLDERTYDTSNDRTKLKFGYAQMVQQASVTCLNWPGMFSLLVSQTKEKCIEK
jgi:hypothetical protein